MFAKNSVAQLGYSQTECNLMQFEGDRYSRNITCRIGVISDIVDYGINSDGEDF